MKLHRFDDNYSWDLRAEEYRAVAEQTDDDLARLGYLQLAQYCDSMAARTMRGSRASVGENIAAPSSSIALDRRV